MDSFLDRSKQNFYAQKYEPNPINVPKGGILFCQLYNVNVNILVELQCPLCYNLIWKAKECIECGKVFYEYCLNKSIGAFGKKCPFCRNKLEVFIEAKNLKPFFGKI